MKPLAYDNLNGASYLILLSTDIPNLTSMVHKFGVQRFLPLNGKPEIIHLYWNVYSQEANGTFDWLPIRQKAVRKEKEIS